MQQSAANNPYAASRFAPADKIVLHSQFVDYMAGKRVVPVNVEISPSGICQATCPFCFYANTGELGHHRNVMIDGERLAKLLNECCCLRVKSISWTGGGEPTLHPSFVRMVAIANSVGLQQGLFTNALATPLYNPALMQWIRVTMTDKPVRPDYIKQMRPAKTLGFAFNYSGIQDDAYLLETLKVAEEVGADYVQVRPALKFHGATVDISPPAITHPLMHVADYKFEEARRHHGYAQCEAYHLSPFIWEDGNVDTCSYMRKHAGHTLGNIYNNTLKEILDAAPPSVLVKPSCQTCCKLHEMNKAIHGARRLEDVNFP